MTLLPPAPGPDEVCTEVTVGASGLVSAAVTVEVVVVVVATVEDVVVVEDVDAFVVGGDVFAGDDVVGAVPVSEDEFEFLSAARGAGPLFPLLATRATTAATSSTATPSTTLARVEERSPDGDGDEGAPVSV